MPQAIRAKLPPLYANEGKPPAEVPVIVKYFSPFTNWTWYITEYDGDDIMYGFVAGEYPELGYVSLRELQHATVYGAPAVERDLYYEPHTLADVMPREMQS
jgi:hypothetical protein